jgi:hypothetical protein
MNNLPESQREYVQVKAKYYKDCIAYYNTQGNYRGFWHVGKRNKNGKFYPKVFVANEWFQQYYMKEN